MLNGDTLKIAFLMIVGPLCVLCVVLTVGAGFNFVPLNDYVQLLGELGIVGVFTQIIQAFIHYNQGDSNAQKTVSTISSVDTTIAK